MRTTKSQQVLEHLLAPDAANRLWKKLSNKNFRKIGLGWAEPDWNTLVAESGLPTKEAQRFVAGLKRMWLLSFRGYEGARALLDFCFKELPQIEVQCDAKNDRQRKRFCSLLRFFLVMALQGRSIYPRNPVELGTRVFCAIRDPLGCNSSFGPLADILLDKNSDSPQAGRNALVAEDPDQLLKHELEICVGSFEKFVGAQHKFDDYRRRLLRNPQFRSDWKIIVTNYPVARHIGSDGAIRPTWELNMQSMYATGIEDLTRQRGQFFLVFDFFCWKWFLRGMTFKRGSKADSKSAPQTPQLTSEMLLRDGSIDPAQAARMGQPMTPEMRLRAISSVRDWQPIVEEPRLKLTPLGTEIYIPGYWSLDAHRDVLWKQVLKLHRARGVPRQGAKLARNRMGRDAQLRKILQAERDAREKGLKGGELLDLLKQAAGFSSNTDDAQMYRLLRQAKRSFPASHAQP